MRGIYLEYDSFFRSFRLISFTVHTCRAYGYTSPSSSSCVRTYTIPGYHTCLYEQKCYYIIQNCYIIAPLLSVHTTMMPLLQRDDSCIEVLGRHYRQQLYPCRIIDHSVRRTPILRVLRTQVYIRRMTDRLSAETCTYVFPNTETCTHVFPHTFDLH